MYPNEVSYSFLRERIAQMEAVSDCITEVDGEVWRQRMSQTTRHPTHTGTASPQSGRRSAAGRPPSPSQSRTSSLARRIGTRPGRSVVSCAWSMAAHEDEQEYGQADHHGEDTASPRMGSVRRLDLGSAGKSRVRRTFGKASKLLMGAILSSSSSNDPPSRSCADGEDMPPCARGFWLGWYMPVMGRAELDRDIWTRLTCRCAQEWRRPAETSRAEAGVNPRYLHMVCTSPQIGTRLNLHFICNRKSPPDSGSA